ncbi:MAG: TSUP family transporter, partial [Candidatus Poseidonia sp.]|nr:TSUP family transporter [Poseidonia sp.]
ALRAGTGIGGLLSSVLAIGAGVIYVPVLQQIGQLQTRKAIGTSLHLMLVVVPVAILTHLLFLSTSEWQALGDLMALVLLFSLAAYMGSTMGARFGLRYMSQSIVMRVFLALVVITLLRYVLDLVQTLS